MDRYRAGGIIGPMRRKRSALGPLLALTVLTGCTRAPLLNTDGVVAITHATLIDGTGDPPREDVTLVVQNGRVSRIVDSPSLRIGPRVTEIPAAGKWVLPGFIDCHAHLPSEKDLTTRFRTHLDHGITAARSPATDTAHGVDVRQRLEDGRLLGPTYRMAGGLIDGVGAYFDYAEVVTSEEEIRRVVRQQAAAGVDYIKLYTQLTPDLVAAAIDEAHSQGLRVIGHLGRTSWSEAADMGIDALTHSGPSGMATSVVSAEEVDTFSDFFWPNDWRKFDPSLFASWVDATQADGPIRQLGRQLAEQKVILDPTLTLFETFARGDDPALYERLVPQALREDFSPHPSSSWMTAAERTAAKLAFDRTLEIVGMLHHEGVLLTAGTDSDPWIPPGIGFHRELELLSASGIPNMDVIVIATRNGAMSLDLLDELGTVEPGKRADLVILDADPLETISNTQRIHAVLRGGVVVSGQQPVESAAH